MKNRAPEAAETTLGADSDAAPASGEVQAVGAVGRNPLFEAAQRRFRAQRFRHIDAMIRQLLRGREKVTILDAGGRAVYWTMLAPGLRDKVSLTLLNIGSELQAYDAVIDGLAIENHAGDACDMPQYDDGQFDLVHSNSVVEHVGSYVNMLAFAREVRRVGRAYYVQTPNFWFPVDPHYAMPFVHWLPDPIRIGLFQSVRVGRSGRSCFEAAMQRGDATKIISTGMMRRLFPDARIEKERFALMTKSVMAIRDAS